MSGYLIKDTTKQEREQIVSDSLGNILASCDGCMPGLAEMYQEYIDGKKGRDMGKQATGSVKEKCIKS